MEPLHRRLGAAVLGKTGGLRGRRVLIVEDESMILLMLEEIVAGLGCEVVGAAVRADAALAVVADGPLDAALLDVNLGDGRTSYPVAEALAARGVPFAFLTGYGPASVRVDFRDRPVLSKPVHERGLEAVLQLLLAGAPAPHGHG